MRLPSPPRDGCRCNPRTIAHRGRRSPRAPMTAQAARPSLRRMLTSSTNPTDGPSKSPSSTDDRPSPPPPAALAENAILVRGLRCSYGPIEAVKGIDLEIMRGEIFALLGPNGEVQHALCRGGAA